MNINVAVLLMSLLFTKPAIAVDGPPAEDEKWECCNDRQDAGLEQLSNQLKKKTQYTMKGISPCSSCNVSNLESVRRTNDTAFLKNVNFQPVTTHFMYIGFDSLGIECTCTLPGKLGVTYTGSIFIRWFGPLVYIIMTLNSDKKTVVIPEVTVLSPINKDTAKTNCMGMEPYKSVCEKASENGVFDAVIAGAVQTLFPDESQKTIQSDGNLLLDLNCENC